MGVRILGGMSHRGYERHMAQSPNLHPNPSYKRFMRSGDTSQYGGQPVLQVCSHDFVDKFLKLPAPILTSSGLHRHIDT